MLDDVEHEPEVKAVRGAEATAPESVTTRILILHLKIKLMSTMSNTLSNFGTCLTFRSRGSIPRRGTSSMVSSLLER